MEALARMGRPSKLETTPEIAAGIIELVKQGNYLCVAAQAMGIESTTLARWQQWGREGKEPYATFCVALNTAKAQGETVAVQAVRAGAQGWQGSAWWLERSRPDRWASDRKKKVAETKLIREKTRALVDFDAILAGATPEEIARIQEIVASVRKRTKGDADGGAGASPTAGE